MTNEARQQILARIRSAASTGASTSESAAEAWLRLPRVYHRHATLGQEAMLDLFESRARDYGAGVLRVATDQVEQGIAALLDARGKRRLLLPSGFAAPLPPGYSFVVDPDPVTGALPSAQMDLLDGVITACTVAIAETGTLVLQSVPGQGRRAATLVPDYHLCLVRVDQVVETVPEGMARLLPTAHLPTTLISGPSATADIEMTRIEGVHGPRTLDVLLVRD
ncbi:MAG TPA: LUD domain-containing protein [Acidobacteriaceae bacterium]